MKTVIRLLCIIRTILLLSVGFLFFRAPSIKIAVTMLKNSFQTTYGLRTFLDNLISGGVTYSNLGERLGMLFILINCVMMLAVEIMKYNKIDPIKWLSERPGIVRWSIYWNISISVFLSMFDTAKDFIYAGF